MAAEQNSSLASLRLGALLIVGADILTAMKANQGKMKFAEWSDQVIQQNGGSVPSQELIWLWNALKSAPSLSYIGYLPSAPKSYLDSARRIKIFDAGEWFLIGMKPAEVSRLLTSATMDPLEETVAVQTFEQLNLRPGKGNRLECCDCLADVTIRVTALHSIEREADIMCIEKSNVTLGKDIVKVRVNSLNQAYTVASRRLEPERRSHGGRTYDHVVHHAPGRRTRLEEIRRRAENGD